MREAPKQLKCHEEGKNDAKMEREEKEGKKVE